MKTLLNILAIALLGAGVPESRADTAASAKEPQSAILIWNQIARDALAGTKSTQHQAMRLLTHVSLAQYAALAGAPSESSADAIATASKEVIAALVPSQAEYAVERYRELQVRDDAYGRRAAERALAAAASDGFSAPWNGLGPKRRTLGVALRIRRRRRPTRRSGACAHSLSNPGIPSAPRPRRRSAMHDSSRIWPKYVATPNRRPRTRRGSRSSTT
ncbi:hypothetical protein [Thiocapsa sp.]|uniref:hypothetical protein n=1 Tax=Thiocapsa sp. TaxID=2024551 RepID=UPI003592F1A5